LHEFFDEVRKDIWPGRRTAQPATADRQVFALEHDEINLNQRYPSPSRAVLRRAASELASYSVAQDAFPDM
jgi:hypothetical protein